MNIKPITFSKPASQAAPRPSYFNTCSLSTL